MIEEWATYDGDDFMENVEPNLKSILCRMKDAGDFDKVTILKPYSFVLVDEDKETVAELLLIDDDTLLVDDELLKGLDKELDEFLKICWRNKYVRLPGMPLLKQLSFIKNNRK